MKILAVSDLHVNHSERAAYESTRILRSDVAKAADVIVIAGDIGTNVWQLNACRPVRIIAITGNHDHYSTNIHQASDSRVYKSPDIGRSGLSGVLLDPGVITRAGVKFVGATLWYPPEHVMDPKMKGFTDFSFAFGGGPNGRKTMCMLHECHMAFLEEEVEEGCVVITHTAPSLKSIHPDYKDDELNPLFAMDLDDFILKRKPKLWIHGHVHNHFDYMVGDTRIYCNPLGYEREMGSNGFKLELIEV